MKTTIELPDDLLMALKLRALAEHKKFKILVMEVLEMGLNRRPVPVRKEPPSFRLTNGYQVSEEELLGIIAAGRNRELPE